MLSIQTIDRTLEQRDYDRLLRDLGRNGLVMPLPLRVQLAESPVGAHGLGLRRLVELSYGPTALIRQLVDKLARAQTPNGAITDAAGRDSALLTACFLAGMGRVLRDHQGKLAAQQSQVELAYDQALTALAAMQQDDGLFATGQDRNLRDRLLTSGFIAYLLIDAPDFAARCHGHALLSALENHLDHCDPATAQLIEMARLTRLIPESIASHPHRQPQRTSKPSLLNAA